MSKLRLILHIVALFLCAIGIAHLLAGLPGEYGDIFFVLCDTLLTIFLIAYAIVFIEPEYEIWRKE